MAVAAEAGLSKTMNAWPLARKLRFAIRSMMVPYSEKISRRAEMSAGGLIDSSRLRTYTLEDRKAHSQLYCQEDELEDAFQNVRRVRRIRSLRVGDGCHDDGPDSSKRETVKC